MKNEVRISYLHTTPPPILDGTDAVHNEVKRLASHFNGRITNLYPFRRPSSILPRSLYGWHKLSTLKALDQQKVIHHVFSPTLAYYPILNQLKNPIVFSVSANVGSGRPANSGHMKKWSRIIVSNSRDFDQLKTWGFTNIEVILPGIDLTAFPRLTELPPGKFTLLVASAPWEKKQFETKGINLLLQAVKTMPNIKLILLWRGLYLKEIKQKIGRLKISSQVEIIDGKANVSHIMKRSHVTVLLAKEAGLVKAFPHSLVESLASGRPVLVSDIVPIADFIKKHQCGQILAEFNLPFLTSAINTMRNEYQQMTANIPQSISTDFSVSRMIEGLESIYVGVK